MELEACESPAGWDRRREPLLHQARVHPAVLDDLAVVPFSVAFLRPSPVSGRMTEFDAQGRSPSTATVQIPCSPAGMSNAHVAVRMCVCVDVHALRYRVASSRTSKCSGTSSTPRRRLWPRSSLKGLRTTSQSLWSPPLRLLAPPRLGYARAFLNFYTKIFAIFAFEREFGMDSCLETRKRKFGMEFLL